MGTHIAASRSSRSRLDDEVIAWRAGQLVGAGFTAHLAAMVAREVRFDLHAVIELVERGCPPELAVRILAPLEETSSGRW